MITRGTIIAIGGNEDKGIRTKKSLHVLDTDLNFATSGILCQMLSELDNEKSGVDIITSASSEPEKTGKKYLRAFRLLGHKNIQVLNPVTKTEADMPEVLDRISKTSCLMFSGGDQFKLVNVLQGTKFAEIMIDRYKHEKIVIAGTSAGSMALPDLMIYPGKDPKGTHAKDVIVYKGLGLIDNLIIDTHFLVRSRFRRLAVAVANHPNHIGIGLEEDTGIIIREGNKIEAIGSGLATIIDAKTMRLNQKENFEADQEIFIGNLLIHMLAHGNRLMLNNTNQL